MTADELEAAERRRLELLCIRLALVDAGRELEL